MITHYNLNKLLVSGMWKICLLYIGIFLFSLPVLSQPMSPEAYHLRTVVIDPGHGGKDPGATVGKNYEKNIALDIALKLGKYINKEFPDVKVIYTRKGDYFLPLYQRASIANQNNADLFISIHANYIGKFSIQGTETYTLGLHRTKDNLEVAKKENSVILMEEDHSTRYAGFDPNQSESYILFELVQDEFLEQSLLMASLIQDQFRVRAKRYDRGVRQAGFLVLRETSMPSVLIEAGYMSHKNELQYLLTDSGRSVLASAIFRAFRDYKEKIEARSSMTVREKSKEPKKDYKANTKATPDLNQGIVFAIQVASSVKEIPLDSENFKGISDISSHKVGNSYKYLAFVSSNPDYTLNHQESIRKKIPGAFMVAFEDGKPINVKKAKQKLWNH